MLNTTMSKIELKLHNKSDDRNYHITVTENGKESHFSIENNQSTLRENMKMIRLKINSDGELEKEINEPLLISLISSKMLLRANKTYIEEVKIDKIDGNTVLSIIAQDDYRHRIGQKRFNYKIDGVWVSLHVVKEGKNHYLVVESSLT